MKKKQFISSLILLTAISTLVLTGCGSSGAEGTSPDVDITESTAASSLNNPAALYTGAFEQNSITVNSSEQVTVVPDIAQVIYSVRSQAKDAAGCQQKNAEAVNQVIEQLKSLNIAETSIQTTDYYINPIYNYSNGNSTITGYEAITTLTVSDLPIDGLSEILTASVSSGVNTIQSVTYQASSYDESYQQALKDAMASALEKAAILAEAAGGQVGSVLRIEETSHYSATRYTNGTATNEAAFKKQATMEDTAQIMPGEIGVEASIIVEYQLVR